MQRGGEGEGSSTEMGGTEEMMITIEMVLMTMMTTMPETMVMMMRMIVTTVEMKRMMMETVTYLMMMECWREDS